MIGGRMRGAAEMVAKLRQIAAKFPDRVAAALYQEAQIEVTEMKRRTPVDVNYEHGRIPPHPGNLRASIFAEEPKRSGRRISVTVATGVQAPYAVYVHENPDAIHPVGQARFMASVIDESRSFMAARIAARVQLNKDRA